MKIMVRSKLFQTSQQFESMAEESDSESGREIQLSGSTRRDFIKYLSVSGMGIAGLNSATKRVFGKKPDGVPIVLTRGRDGKPMRIMYVSKERARRFKVFNNIRPEKKFSAADRMTGMTIDTKDGEEDSLRIKIYLDSNKQSVRRKFPNRVDGTPIIFEERNNEFTPECRIDDQYTVLKGNIQIATQVGAGTLGLVARDSSTNDPVLLTAWHVVDTDKDVLYQPTWSDKVGDYADHTPDNSTGHDIVKYDFYNNGSQYPGAVGATEESSQPDITSLWTFSGLSQYLDLEGRFNVNYAGRNTCSATSNCYDVAKNSILNHTAYMDSHPTEKGDSGGPWVDDNGALVCLHTGVENGTNDVIGGVASEAFDSVNAKL